MSETASEETSESHSFRERLASVSPAVLIGILAVAVAVAGIAGFGIGVKVEQHRVKSDKKTAAAKTRPATRKNTNAAAGRTVPLVPSWYGTIASRKNANVRIKTARGNRTVRLTFGTTILKANAGSASDLKSGAHVIFKSTQGATKAILVLPSTVKGGLVVTAATPTTMTVQVRNKPVTVKTDGAAVYVGSTARPTDLTDNSYLMVQSKRRGRANYAGRLVLLPAGVTIA